MNIMNSVGKFLNKVSNITPYLYTIRRASNAPSLRKTPLWNLHQELKAKMTEFSGWEMPLNYGDGIMKEHLHCRQQTGLFDVSHMVGLKITGMDRLRFAETVFPANLEELDPGQGCLTCLPNSQGGLIDDCLVTKMSDHLNVVINAGHEHLDLTHLESYRQRFEGEITISLSPNQGLLALQGPTSAEVLSKYVDSQNNKMSSWKFMSMRNVTIAGVKCQIARSGYTGEDGFEISCPGDSAETLARTLLDHSDVKPIGLAARDSLRLEAGLCLYGNDIDTSTTPIEARLAWTIPKRRRQEANFVGAEKILQQLTDKSQVKKVRIGWISQGGPVRQGQKILNRDDKIVGHITSGLYGPSVKAPIGMAYVDKPLSRTETSLRVEGRRGKFQDIKVTKMPFVTSRIFKS